MKITKTKLKEMVREEIVEMRGLRHLNKKPAVDTSVVIQLIKDKYQSRWIPYTGKKGFTEILNALGKKKTMTPKDIDNVIPGFIPNKEVVDLFSQSELGEHVCAELMELSIKRDKLMGKWLAGELRRSTKFPWKNYIGDKGLELIAKREWTYEELKQIFPEYISDKAIRGLWK